MSNRSTLTAAMLLAASAGIGAGAELRRQVAPKGFGRRRKQTAQTFAIGVRELARIGWRMSVAAAAHEVGWHGSNLRNYIDARSWRADGFGLTKAVVLRDEARRALDAILSAAKPWARERDGADLGAWMDMHFHDGWPCCECPRAALRRKRRAAQRRGR